MPIVYDELTGPDPVEVRPEDLWRMRPPDAHDNIWDAELDGVHATEDERAYFAARDRVDDDALLARMTAQTRVLGNTDYCDGMYP